ncbi:MAG: peroxidase family protein [Pseudomonadota bacterium]
MSPITSPHSLFGHDAPGLARPQTAGNAASQSRYCYRFPHLAEDDRVGCFAGTTAAETFDRLKAFEDASRSPLSRMRVLPMRLPPVYTYFGQFVNHDISAPVGDVVTRPDPPDAVGIIVSTDPPGLDRARRAKAAVILKNFVNEQANPLSLDSLYGDGDGPDSADPKIRALYDADGRRFRLGVTRREAAQVFRDILKDPRLVHHATGARDILRLDGKPLIADHRNDENLVVSQLHLALLLFHNKAVTRLEGRYGRAEECFAAARQLVTLHYHWLILHDFLRNLLSRTAQTVPWAERPQRLPAARSVPLEFTTAAFRFGHSMVGASYDFNANFGPGAHLGPEGATLRQLFDFTSRGNMGQPGAGTLQLPDHWVIDWDRMTRTTVATSIGGAEKIDLTFAPDMLNAMGMQQAAEHGSILFRNLMRGFHRRIPFGQALAAEYVIEPLEEGDIRAALPGGSVDGPQSRTLREVAEELGMLRETPAWLYVLCEARQRERGERIGPVASQIIADTIVGLMRHMPTSILNQDGGIWHPRQSPLKDMDDEGLTSIRKLLAFAVRDTHI